MPPFSRIHYIFLPSSKLCRVQEDHPMPLLSPKKSLCVLQLFSILNCNSLHFKSMSEKNPKNRAIRTCITLTCVHAISLHWWICAHLYCAPFAISDTHLSPIGLYEETKSCHFTPKPLQLIFFISMPTLFRSKGVHSSDSSLLSD